MILFPDQKSFAKREIPVDYFGESNSVNMPQFFFWGCLDLDHNSAVRADISKQNYSVCPRHWYVDATFKCAHCSETFQFTAAEQKRWYEEFGFYVDSYAKNCPACRQDERYRKALQQEYDRDIEATLQSKDVDAKKRMVGIIDELCSLAPDLPGRIYENQKALCRKITRNTTKRNE